ncbi:MAG: hypothetical protein U0414_32985 [Polyangiaceae bacterium]
MRSRRRTAPSALGALLGRSALVAVGVASVAGCAAFFREPPAPTPPPEPTCTFEAPDTCPALCDGGDASACETLARRMSVRKHGEGMSLALFQRACELGDKASCGRFESDRRSREFVGQSTANRACERSPHGWDAVACKTALDRWSSLCTDRRAEYCRVDELERYAGSHMCRDGSVDDCERGCDAGLWSACRELADIYYRGGSEVASDRGRFVSILDRMCNRGDAESCRTLGLYYAPRGCPPGSSCIQIGDISDTPNDAKTSAHYYELSCRLAGSGCDDLLELERDKWLELPLGVSSFAWEKVSEKRNGQRR